MADRPPRRGPARMSVHGQTGNASLILESAKKCGAIRQRMPWLRVSCPVHGSGGHYDPGRGTRLPQRFGGRSVDHVAIHRPVTIIGTKSCAKASERSHFPATSGSADRFSDRHRTFSQRRYNLKSNALWTRQDLVTRTRRFITRRCHETVKDTRLRPRRPLLEVARRTQRRQLLRHGNVDKRVQRRPLISRYFLRRFPAAPTGGYHPGWCENAGPGLLISMGRRPPGRIQPSATP